MDFRNLPEQSELGFGKDLSGKADSVLDDHFYNVQRNHKDGHVEHEVFRSIYVKVMEMI